MKKFIDLKNKQFFNLKVISINGKLDNGGLLWLCECTCGNKKVYPSSSLIAGRAKSCGCKRIKHGFSKTPTYDSWGDMKQRCLNKNNKFFKDYGGRGIKICKSWLLFKNFLKDMGEKPVGKSLDRINNNGNYCKKNCKWSTPEEQSNNIRKNIKIKYQGITLNLSQWSRKLKINNSTLYDRIIRHGWETNKAFNYKNI